MSEINPADYLCNWATLNKKLTSLNEEGVFTLLDAELKGKKRVQFLLRIYGRANKLRTTRERSALTHKSK